MDECGRQRALRFTQILDDSLKEAPILSTAWLTN